RHQCRVRQPWADRFGNFERRRALQHFLLAPIGELDVNGFCHGRFSLWEAAKKGQTSGGVIHRGKNSATPPGARVGVAGVGGEAGAAQWLAKKKARRKVVYAWSRQLAPRI